jgi:hypothetical protein
MYYFLAFRKRRRIVGRSFVSPVLKFIISLGKLQRSFTHTWTPHSSTQPDIQYLSLVVAEFEEHLKSRIPIDLQGINKFNNFVRLCPLSQRYVSQFYFTDLTNT